MTDKQYESMTIIMQFCRIFSEQMYECMKNAGLIQQGYSLDIFIGNQEVYPDGSARKTADIHLDKSVYDSDWDETRMNQSKYRGKDWIVYADPKAEVLSVPKSIDIGEIERQEERTAVGREVASKPYPVDGLWIGNDYNSSDVDGGF